MKILLVGGGSGGHITPLLAIAKQLKRDKPDVIVKAVTERFGKFNHLFKGASYINSVNCIFAGKLRRYHKESWLKRVTDIKTISLNLRDIFFLSIGFFESIVLLVKFRPDIVFIKGGYVGVPVGIACRFLKVPYITHDSDATPGLTNRLIGSGAVKNAVGMPPDMYRYNSRKVVYVGVPIKGEYKFSKTDSQAERNSLHIDKDDFLILVLGGSNGAQRVDSIVHKALHPLLKDKNIKVIHQVGEGNEKIYQDYPPGMRDRVETYRFISPVISYEKAADLIVSRAGATVLAEVASLKKPVIVVPHPELTGGHQVANAKILEKEKAAIIIDETYALEKPEIMTKAIKELMDSQKKREEIAQNLNNLVPGDATEKVSKLLIEVAESNQKSAA